MVQGPGGRRDASGNPSRRAGRHARMQGMDLTTFLGQLRIPVLYTRGEFDEATPSSVRRFADLTPGSKAIVFLMASHSHHLEKEDEHIASVRSFLSSADQTAHPS